MTETNQHDEKMLDPSQYKAIRLEATKELREEIKFLEVEEKYRRLLADIEDHKARRLRAIAIQYQFQNPAPQDPTEDFDHEKPSGAPFASKAVKTESRKTRSLKKN